MISDISGMRMRGKFKNALLNILHLVDARLKKILGEFEIVQGFFCNLI
jgi:hypothetical protein